MTFDDSTTVDLGGEQNNQKDIIMAAFRRCGDCLTVEFRGGFYNSVPTKAGLKEEYVSDTRDVFCNSVEALRVFLYPKFDKKTKSFNTSFNTKVSKLEKDFIVACSASFKIVLGEGAYDSDEDRILLMGLKNEKAKEYLTLFRELSCLLKRLNYLEIGGKTF